MKKTILILLASILIIGCSSEKRVLLDELENKSENWLESVMHYDGELFSGVGYDVYENGQLQKEEAYKNGQLHGAWKEWYKDGKIWLEGSYKNGKEHGLEKWWHSNGALKFQGEYENGTLISQTCFDKNGVEVQCK